MSIDQLFGATFGFLVIVAQNVNAILDMAIVADGESEPTDKEAYQLWEQNGRPEAGREDEF